jgi:hypothetical protein
MSPAASTARVAKRRAAGMFGVPRGEVLFTDPPISRPRPLDNGDGAGTSFSRIR